ncbi:hypothetical protein SPRG_03667 [Saprolegnia parasitica CBS 223.65]|uniref:RxLR effector protein n=1 Tax=Saprolegnia parasitica (strain CBS 223.65) TaxID=695850 RepID=A0A067CY85_SAPPC|nr:hypothetical protein SPRG_03667 [Saprolegnia parasitica CBS 223.65]KDO31747.1 hypothetical protein SPRG_03667 [Saprolegnia parasitica CBS 223.65]|eukprot:XP_012197627.1 hypothetical protein SPRG_03667 [Saprolegnia parasitica CBS 223.65]
MVNSFVIFAALIASSSATVVAVDTPAMGIAAKVDTEASHKQPQQLREGGQKECFGSICGGGFGFGWDALSRLSWDRDKYLKQASCLVNQCLWL